MTRAAATLAPALRLALLACALATGCAEPTEIVVHVWTDMRVPTDVDFVRIGVFHVGDADPAYDNVVPLPASGSTEVREQLSFGAGPRGEDTTRRVRVLVTAMKDGAPLFTTEVRTGFARRKRLRLDVYLAGRCLTQARTCRPDQTCGLYGCVSPDVPVDALRPADEPPTSPTDPRTGDAGATPDAGTALDAALGDAALSSIPAPRQLAPQPTARVFTAQPSLSWLTPPGADMVGFEVFRLPDLTRFVTAGDTATPGGTTVSVPLSAGVYAWHVRSIDAAGAASAWSPLWTFRVPRGVGSSDRSFGVFPDFDGDGLGDLAVAQPAGPGVAEAHVIVTTSTGTLTDIRFVPTETSLPLACADVNGDGYVDLLVGRPTVDGGAGQVALHFGTPMGVLTAGSIALFAPATARQFGQAIASIGDWNRDGFGDVVIGAPGSNVVYVYEGSGTGLHGPPSAVLPATGGAAGWGEAVAGADLNGDGTGDVLVGVRAAPTLGAVWAQLGGSGISALTGGPAGLSPGFGTVLARGDFTRGPTDMVAIGSPFAGAVLGVGEPGATLALGAAPIVPPAGTGGKLALAGAGDRTGDGLDDLVLGMPDLSSGTGEVWIRASEGTLLARVSLPSMGTGRALIGTAVAYVGDMDGDLVDDLAIGAPGAGTVVVLASGDPMPRMPTGMLGFGAAICGAQ